jgi:hypothetical protein
MKVVNIHERVVDSTVDQVGKLIDTLASPDDLLWPIDRWTPMRFDRPLSVGASGGHGPIGYFVEAYEPGRSIRFRFTKPDGFNGTHRFEAESVAEGKTRLRHVIDMQAAGRALPVWIIAIRPLHNALMEDALDRAEASLGKKLPQRKWPCWVKFLRGMMQRRKKKAELGKKG